MAPGSRAWRSPRNNPLADLTREQDELASPQDLAERSDAGSDKTPTPLEALNPPLVPSTKDLFTKFMKVFVELIQAQNRGQAELREQLLKNRSLETYSEKSHIDCYHFCQ